MKREQLAAIYIEWVNNWLTIGAWADYYGLTDNEAETLWQLARSCAYNQRPNE